MNVKIPKRVLLLGIVFFFLTQAGYAQATLIEKKRVVVSRSLSGNVEVGMGVPGKNVTVELYSADWQTLLASTKTDDNGYFSMRTVPGKLFYIRFSSPGNNTYQLRVRIKKHAAHDLKIHLSVAT
jgi:Carboxypeptidase regulatory-like domain